MPATVEEKFSGDSIPAHLLTREVVLHLSNRFIDCRPLVYRTGLALQARVCYKKGRGDGEKTFNSDWAALTWDDGVFQKLTKELGWIPVEQETVRRVRAWTDEYSTILPYLRVRDYTQQGHKL